MINDGPWPWVPSECGLAMTGWAFRRSSDGRVDVFITLEPLTWQETVCRWLDEQVEL